MSALVLFSYNASAKTKKTPAAAEVPATFKSDACTFFPDGDYRECCVVHDREYYVGGSWRDRLHSDDRLFGCVFKKKGVLHKLAAPLMWTGTRVAGVGFLPTPFHWGFGQKKKNPAASK